MSMNLELRKKLGVAMEEAKKKGKHLVIAVLDDAKESLEIVTTYPKTEAAANLKMLDAILQTALADEENDGEEERPTLIH